MFSFPFAVQRLELQKNQNDDGETVRGQIVISLITRDRGGLGLPLPVPELAFRGENELPEG